MTTTALPTTSPYSAAAGPGSTPFWTAVLEHLDIAPSLYQKAADRHISVGEWLCRPGSSLARYGPVVRPQGSFRFGTVVKPLFDGASYDVDQVVVLTSLKQDAMSQADLRTLFRSEIEAYARAKDMQTPEPKHRCERLNYRDEVPFHLDSLPAVPAGVGFVGVLRTWGVDPRWAEPAVAITDDRRLDYTLVGADWLTSNPSGFARWFKARAAQGLSEDAQRSIRASVEPVPTYRWRTPLQRAIQILKRHRDVMFQHKPELAPISMIITNLAAHAYQGEQDLGSALHGIVSRMHLFVQTTPPRVPNPSHPEEDYADRWRDKPELERSLYEWLTQARAHVEFFSGREWEPAQVEKRFAVRLTEAQVRKLAPRTAASAAPAVITHAAAPQIDSGPRPWAAVRRTDGTR